MPDSFREGDYGSAVLRPGHRPVLGAPTSTSGSDAQLATSGRTKITSFSLVSAIGTDFYSVNANAGDNLHFATTTPAGGPNEFVNNFYPELLLYDPNGNLVAVAAGNASDGRNSVIDFTVPDGDAGKWTIEVTPSPNTPTPTQGEYGLLVTGATGRPGDLRRHQHHPGRRGPGPAADRLHRHLQRAGPRDLADPGRADDQRRAGHRR